MNIDKIAADIRENTGRYDYGYPAVVGMIRAIASDDASGYLSDSERLQAVRDVLAALDLVRAAGRPS